MCSVKKIIPALLLMLLVACTKQSLTAPTSTTQTVAANTAVTYKDNSISIVNFKAQPTDKTIEVAFTTLYAKNIVRLEILRGLSANNLCSIYKQEVSADSYSAIVYNTSDANENGASEIYYMVKYTLANGDWGYTPVFTLSL
jgi:uncharacterized lipoprotein YajG